MELIEEIILNNFEMHPQEDWFTCGAANMRSYIQYHKKVLPSEKELFEIGYAAELAARIPSDRGNAIKTREEGLSHVGMYAIARAYGLKGFTKTNTSLDEIKFFIRAGLPVLMDFWSPRVEIGEGDNDHYSMIRGFRTFGDNVDGRMMNRREVLHIADPGDPEDEEFGLYYTMDFPDFKKRWCEKLPHYIYPHWIAVFYREPPAIPYIGVIPFRGDFVR